MYVLDIRMQRFNNFIILTLWWLQSFILTFSLYLERFWVRFSFEVSRNCYKGQLNNCSLKIYVHPSLFLTCTLFVFDFLEFFLYG
jgi:hypothetical protein